MFNYISNGFVDKMVDDLRSNFFPQISLLRKVLKFPCVFNHISNGLVEKMMDDLGSIFFSPSIIIGKVIGISIRELNKVHNICVQFMDDKKNKRTV